MVMIEIDVAFLNVYKVVITNRDEPIFVCAFSFNDVIKKVERFIDQFDDRDKYSIISISYVSPILN